MVIDGNKLINDFSGSKCIKKHNPSNRNRLLSNNITTPLLIYHRNIRGLRNKIEELFILFSDNLPHILCSTEHHLFNDEINSVHINPYNLGTSYSRANHNYGGVSVLVHETISYSPTDLSNFCHEQDIEICAVKLHLAFATLCILSVYRSPTGNFLLFLSTLDSILGKLFTNSLNIVICGDLNINYLEDSTNKLKLDSLLASYNLHSTVDIPTRITNSSSTTIDNIFINKHLNIGFSMGFSMGFLITTPKSLH
jgi:exonuclease III